ncbi:MAG: response regulator receiver [Puniceicoccaceae bacterium 5H]|nr:MAG: response regulator receiver [Puniceicoccaceae bacterium 5H]
MGNDGGSSTTFQAHEIRTYLGLLKATVENLIPMLPFGVDRQEVYSFAVVGLVRALEQMPEGLQPAERARDVEEGIATAVLENFHGDDMVAPSGADAAPPEAEVSPDFHALDLRGSRILLVDDSAVTRRTMQRVLEKAGFRITEATSGEEALNLSRQHKQDLVLLDVQMEGLDGYETCRQLKAIPTMREVPVIFLTNLSDAQDVMRGFEAGASDYISKPFHPGESLSRIRLHLQNKALLAYRQRSIDELKKVNQTKDKFLRMVSHDLRNPVSAIGGLAQMMSDGMTGELNEEQREMTDSIVSAADGMTALLNDLLDYAAIEGGEAQFKPGYHSLLKEIQRVVTLQRVVAERKKIGIELAQADDVPEPLYFDRQGVQRVLENLISNAIKFSPYESRVSVVLRRRDDFALIDVEDEGPGIPTGEEDKLFKEFSRTSNRPTGGEKSTGLGLSICRKIVEMHHGQIEAENLPGKGARFRIQLPLTAG